MKTLRTTIGSGCGPVVLHYTMQDDLDPSSIELWNVYTDTPESFDLSDYLSDQQWIDLEMECMANERDRIEYLDYQARLKGTY